MTPDEIREKAEAYDTPHSIAWGPAAEICERLDAIVAALSHDTPEWVWEERELFIRRGTEIDKLRTALRSVREQIDSGPDVSWDRVEQTIAKALGEEG